MEALEIPHPHPPFKDMPEVTVRLLIQIIQLAVVAVQLRRAEFL
jgi:hypothetical protein